MDTILAIVKAMLQNESLDVPYTDYDLQKLIIAIGNMMIPEFGYNDIFTANFSTFTFDPDPDPTIQSHNLFINLVALKTVIGLTKAEAKKMGSIGKIKVSDSPASVEVTDRYESLKEHVKQLEEDYDKVKFSYMVHGNLGGYSPKVVINLGRC